MMQKKEEVKSEEKKLRYELVEVPTQTQVLIKDNLSGKAMDLNIAVMEILNSLNELKQIAEE